jgi:hypothetical protein
MSKGESRTTETSQITATSEDSRVEVGRNQIRFYSQIASYPSWVRFDMGYSGSLTKVAHFIPVKTTYSGAKLTELYMSRIMCLNGVPKKIMSDRGSQFTSMFLEKLHESMYNKLNFSSAYHRRQMDKRKELTKS